MTDETNTQDQEPIQPDELTVLKERADKMGIQYHPSIGVDKLRAKINEILAQAPNPPAASHPNPADVEAATIVPARPAVETETQRRIRKKKEAGELVRIRATCMNPNKREWEGEVFTASNSVVGTFKKYVPFDTEWHVPRIIFNQMKQRQCQVFVTVRDGRGNKVRKGKLIKEFAIEVLPNLSREELKDLAQRQAMANGTAETA